MLRSIIQKELLENLFSYKFSIIVILSTILILVSIFVMYSDYSLALENYEVLQPKSSEPIAIISPTPLSIFAKGLNENLCRSHEITFGGQIKVGSKQQSVNNLFRLFTTPDLLYIIKVILSLCAILFTFDMVCGEKEAGTLRLAMSNSLKRPILIIGKWIGGFTSFILPFLMAVLLGTVFITLSPLIQMNAQHWTKLGMFLVSSIIYLAVFFSLGLLISCLTHQSSSSLVISLFIWATLVFLIPNLGNILARQLVEIPTVQQLEIKREQFWIKEAFDLNNQKQNLTDAVKVINSKNDKLVADYRNRYNRLINVSQNITRFSPTAAFTYLATDLMGTGISEERKLKQAVLQYKNLVSNNRNPMDFMGKQNVSFPAFIFQGHSIREVLSIGGLSNLVIIIIFNMLFFASAYIAFLRYDVR